MRSMPLPCIRRNWRMATSWSLQACSQAPALNVEKHQGYAFQWYALSVMALLFFVFTGFKREPSQAE
jgi:cytochrome oxidase assembly protein ShyY1